MAMAAMRKWLVGGWGKEGSRKPRPPGWDDHLGARKPLFGEAALSAFSMHLQSISQRRGMGHVLGVLFGSHRNHWNIYSIVPVLAK